MPVNFRGLIEDVDSWNGKNGFGATIVVSARLEDKRIKRLEFRTKDKQVAESIESAIGEQCEITIQLNQNGFGLQFGKVLDVVV